MCLRCFLHIKSTIKVCGSFMPTYTHTLFKHGMIIKDECNTVLEFSFTSLNMIIYIIHSYLWMDNNAQVNTLYIKIINYHGRDTNTLLVWPTLFHIATLHECWEKKCVLLQKITTDTGLWIIHCTVSNTP